MCGIAGWVGQGLCGDAESLINAMRHRGPDSSGTWSDPRGGTVFVHTRLAILDLSDAGAQPMVFSSGNSQRCDDSSGTTVGDDSRFVLVFNGEIYNYQELRDELESLGETFHGNSDTEVLLRLLVRRGTDAIPMLAGMFAFAFLDCESGHVILARDGFGIKPLYYSIHGNSLAFASEQRALQLLVPDAALDHLAVRDLLLWGTVAEPATISPEIRQLPSGSWMKWNGSKANIQRWYELTTSLCSPPADPIATTRDALCESMQRHLVADVPVGIFLSGGIDSTAILALAREVMGASADLRTFSIGFDDPKYDESSLASRTAEHFGTRHTEWRITPEEGRNEIAGYLAAMDQPTTDGFNAWCVSKLASREGMKVVLSGLGGDELFAGYDSFRRVPQFLNFYDSLGPLRSVVSTLLKCSPAGSRWRRLAAYLQSNGSPLAAFHAQRGIFTDREARRLTQMICGKDPGAVDWRIEGVPSNQAESVSFLELTRYMRNQLLRDSDVFSMAHGLELRVPLVDTRLYQTIAAIPTAVRLRPGKQLLLDAVPEIPVWIRNQPKRGFRFPFEEWMLGSFGDVLEIADKRTTVPLVTWYRRWALAVLLTPRPSHPVS